MGPFLLLLLLALFSGLSKGQTNGEGYIGCYVDQGNRDLPFNIGDNHTPSTCNNACLNAGYAYFGLQYFGECRCGNSYGRYGSSNICSSQCNADSRYICGNAWANSIYHVGVATALNQAKVTSRIGALTNEHLHAGFALMKDYLPQDLDPQVIVAHIKAGTVPTLTSSQHQALQAIQASQQVTDLARRGQDTCTDDTISICIDSFSLLIGLWGIQGRALRELNSIRLTPQEARSFEGVLRVLTSSSASLLDRAGSFVSLVTGFMHLVGLSSLSHMVTAHLSWWDYVKTAVSLAAQFALWFTTDGAALVAEVVLELESAVDLGLDINRYSNDGCGQTPALPAPPVLPIHLAQAGNGKLEVFLVDQNNAVLHRFQNPDLSWSDWESLSSGYVSRLAVASNLDGRLEAFGIGGENIFFRTTQNPAAPGGWNTWTSHGGWTSELAVGVNNDGRLEAFGIGSSNRAYHFWQNAVNSNSWSNWEALSSSTPMIKLSVSQHQDGRLQVLGIGTDQALYYANQDPNGPGGWSWNWQSLGGHISSMVTCINQGFIEVFAIGDNQMVYHNWQLGPNNPSWNGWIPLFSMQAKQLAATRLSSGMPIVFAIGLDQTIYYNALTSAGGWSNWKSLGGSASSITAITTKAGIVQVFALFGGDKNIHVLKQLKASDPFGWSQWIPLN